MKVCEVLMLVVSSVRMFCRERSVFGGGRNSDFLLTCFSSPSWPASSVISSRTRTFSLSSRSCTLLTRLSSLKVLTSWLAGSASALGITLFTVRFFRICSSSGEKHLSGFSPGGTTVIVTAVSNQANKLKSKISLHRLYLSPRAAQKGAAMK